jgi:hypothetical protein
MQPTKFAMILRLSAGSFRLGCQRAECRLFDLASIIARIKDDKQFDSGIEPTTEDEQQQDRKRPHRTCRASKIPLFSRGAEKKMQRLPGFYDAIELQTEIRRRKVDP